MPYLNFLSIKILDRWIVLLNKTSGHELHCQCGLSDSTGAQHYNFKLTHCDFLTFFSLLFVIKHVNHTAFGHFLWDLIGILDIKSTFLLSNYLSNTCTAFKHLIRLWLTVIFILPSILLVYSYMRWLINFLKHLSSLETSFWGNISLK